MVTGTLRITGRSFEGKAGAGEWGLRVIMLRLRRVSVGREGGVPGLWVWQNELPLLSSPFRPWNVQRGLKLITGEVEEHE